MAGPNRARERALADPELKDDRPGAEPMRFDVAGIGEETSDRDLISNALAGQQQSIAEAQQAPPPGVTGKHTDNLALIVPDEVLNRLSKELLEEIESARAGRLEWESLMERGVKALGFDRDKTTRNIPFPGASAVVHPAFAQACIDFQARAAGQLAPPDGPALATVEGEPDQEMVDRAERVTRYLNWQCTKQVTEWSSETERLLMMVGPEGSSFKKVWYDGVMRRPRVAYVPSDRVIAPYTASDEQTTPLLAEEIRVLDQDRKANIQAGLWVEHDPGPPEAVQPSKVEEARKKILGATSGGTPLKNLDPHVYYEAQIRRAIDGLEGGQPAEWLVTLHPKTRKIVALYRNWDQDDPAKERRRILMHYKLFPWDGFYGIGFFHLIGGLSQGATGALRALLDSAMWQNMGGGLKATSGAANGGEIVMAPGQYADVNIAGTDDIRKAIMPNVAPEPSPVLFELLQFLAGACQDFASVALKETAESNDNVPVGTTLARLDEGSRVYCGIYQRLHRVQEIELQTIFKMDGKTLPQQLEWRPFPDQKLTPADFVGGALTVSPASDPHTYSLIQRNMKAQARLQLALQAQQSGVKVNLKDAYMAAGQAQNLPNLEVLFPEDPPPVTADPFSENLQAAKGAALQARPDQDHDGHLTVHLAMASLPGMATNPLGQILIQHMYEHASMGALALATAARMSGAAPGGPIMPPPAQGAPQGIGAPAAAMPMQPPQAPMLPQQPMTDPAAWYQGWMSRIAPCLKPLADPAIEAVAATEMAKVDAEKQKTAIDTEAKLRIAEAESQNKQEELGLIHQQKMAEIAAQQDAKSADLTAKVQLTREEIASRERQKAADIAAKAAEPPKPPPVLPGKSS